MKVVLLVMAIALAGCGGDSTPSGGGCPQVACCKHCNSATSKPCGDTCITNADTCHVSCGCACY